MMRVTVAVLLLALVLAIQIEGSESQPGGGWNKRNLRSDAEPKEDRPQERKLGFFENQWNFLKNARKNWAQGRTWKRPLSDQRVYDVVIIGAGMAGLAAAKELQDLDSSITYIILESTEAIGGRVRHSTMGEAGREVVVEDGATWIFDNDRYPTWTLSEAKNLESTFTDFEDFIVYDEAGDLIPKSTWKPRLNLLDDAFYDSATFADNTFADSEQPGYEDDGVVALLSDNGWTVDDDEDDTGNLDYVFNWYYIDYEYAEADTSVRYFPYTEEDNYHVTDQRGYRSVLRTFKNDNIGDDKIHLNTRVASIEYDESFCDGSVVACNCCGTEYPALVRTTDNVEYLAKRVISTVSVGVLNSGDISFSPALKYPDSVYNYAQYVKVFYQFESKFWDDNEFIFTVRDLDNRGKCHNWQDMDALISGSGIIRCELMTEAFLDLIDADTQELSDATLDSLLDPLREVYTDAVVGTPTDIYYPKLNLDADFGYGAYGNWKVGKSFTDFANYFGGIDQLAPDCDHNGCNSENEWILHFSGSASCYRDSEFVHGAYFAGQRSAINVVDSIYPVRNLDTGGSRCDAFWDELNTSKMASNQTNVSK